MSRTTPTPAVNNQEWALAADDAKEAAASVGKMAGHAVSAVEAIASRAASDVGKQANELTASAGVGIRDLGDRLGQNAPHEGYVGSASQAVARTVREGGEYLEGAKLSGITEDVARVVRRNPIPAILIAIGLGWFAGRTFKR